MVNADLIEGFKLGFGAAWALVLVIGAIIWVVSKVVSSRHRGGGVYYHTALNAPHYVFGEDTVSLDSSSSYQPSTLDPQQHVLFTVTHKGGHPTMYEFYIELEEYRRALGARVPSGAQANRRICEWLLKNKGRATFIREYKPLDSTVQESEK
jgi:hypothetical protein